MAGACSTHGRYENIRTVLDRRPEGNGAFGISRPGGTVILKQIVKN